MEQIKLDVYRGVVHELFIRWDSLKLAVEHMGGRQGQQTAREIRDYVFSYCTQNDNVDEREIADILGEILNDEFETICEDNSVQVLSEHLIKSLKMCAAGEIDQVQEQLTTLPPCINWLDPSFKMTIIENDSSDDDEDDEDDDDDDDDDDMETDEASTNVQNQKQKPHTDEDGWTTIPSRRK